MARYIDAGTLEKGVRACADRKFFCGEVELANGILKSLAMVKQAPTADVAPVVHGEWLNCKNDLSMAQCSNCGELYEVTSEKTPCEEYFNAFKQSYKFCPSCGADMRKAVE